MVSVNKWMVRRNVGVGWVGMVGRGLPVFFLWALLGAAAAGVPYPGITVTRVLYRYVLSSCGQDEYCTWVGRAAGPWAYWVVLSGPQMLEGQCWVQRGCICGRGATSWHAPYQLMILQVGVVDLPWPHCHTEIWEKKLTCIRHASADALLWFLIWPLHWPCQVGGMMA